jgi:hypothetical protein
MKVEIKRIDPDPSIGRIIICNEWKGDISLAQRVIDAVCEKYPKDIKTKFLMTCGGFLTFKLPEKFTKIKGNPESEEIIKEIIPYAQETANTFLSKELIEKLKMHTHYLTLGVDSLKSHISMAQNYITEVHTELVALIDLSGSEIKYHWTGKSYPASGQEKTIIRMVNLETHFFSSEYGKVMLLGCHDLNMFNNRNWKNTSEWRKNIKTAFRELAQRERPVYVLHHPHTTIKTRTWAICWKKMEEMLPSVKEYAGCGRYYENEQERDKIEDVLQVTRKGNTVDFVISRD